jgi:hypothetical protein
MTCIEGISEFDENIFFKDYYLGLSTSTHILYPRQNSSIRKYMLRIKKNTITTIAAMTITLYASFSPENYIFLSIANQIMKIAKEIIIISISKIAENISLF